MSKKSAKQFCKENLGKEIIVSKYSSGKESLIKGMIVGYVETDDNDMIILSFENSIEGWRFDDDDIDKTIKILIHSPLCKSYWFKVVSDKFKFV